MFHLTSRVICSLQWSWHWLPMQTMCSFIGLVSSEIVSYIEMGKRWADPFTFQTWIKLKYLRSISPIAHIVGQKDSPAKAYCWVILRWLKKIVFFYLVFVLQLIHFSLDMMTSRSPWERVPTVSHDKLQSSNCRLRIQLWATSGLFIVFFTCQRPNVSCSLRSPG